MLRFSLPLGSLRVIFETQQSIGVTYVHIVVVKNNAVWLSQPACKHFIYLRAAGVLRIASHHDFASSCVRKEPSAIGRYHHPSRPFKIRGENIYFESLRHGGQKSLRRLPFLRGICSGLGSKWWRKLRLLAVGYLRAQPGCHDQPKQQARNRRGPANKSCRPHTHWETRLDVTFHLASS